VQHSSLFQFAASYGTCFSLQYTALKIRFLLAIFKEGAENVFLLLADMSHLTYTLFIHVRVFL
jgi:hypothetical protein